MPILRLNKLREDRQKMRKLMKALLVWGKSFRVQGVDYQFCYTTGFLKIVHRLITMMTLEEAFWILVSLVRELPRMWCLKESSMLDDGKSLFRLEFSAFKAIIEVHFPRI